MRRKTTVNLTDENTKKLEKYCKTTGAIPTTVINLALKEFLDKMLKKMEK